VPTLALIHLDGGGSDGDQGGGKGGGKGGKGGDKGGGKGGREVGVGGAGGCVDFSALVGAFRQGLTLVQFSAQRKHFLWDTLGTFSK
jgi:hypothetical protein